MVDFRYHLVSIVAVFLALALGIVVGTTRLNGYVLDNLRGSIGSLTNEKRALEGTVGGLRQQTDSDTVLVDRIAPFAVAGQLTGQRVVLVNAPNSSSALGQQLTPLLQAAGATVTGTVQLRSELLDPASAKVVDGVVGRVAPAGTTVPGSDPVQRAAAELAAALLTPSSGSPSSGSPAMTTTSADSVLAGFRDEHLVDAPQDLGPRADLAVLFPGDPVVSADPQAPAARAKALVSFADALDAAGSGAVVSGSAGALQDGGVVKAVRDDVALSERVSSVDDADRPQGRVAVVYALREQQVGGSGRYGTGAGSEGPVPTLPVQ